uniref:Nucleolar protein 14 n=1 Tax=Heterorhabditis bacteriophora TaxID=37862 RepID=A0A1I7XQ25_HETBA
MIWIKEYEITILGKKKGNAGIGHPGLSKKHAYQQREKTLGVEYDRLGKVNKVFVFFSIFSFHLRITYSDILTHGGEVLTSIQKYDRTIASDDEEDTGNIGADVVKAAHFGGGDLEKNRYHSEKLSRKEVIADIIARTKQARQEKQDAKDEQETAIEKIDLRYNQLLDKVQNVLRPIGATKAEKVEKDDYDKLAFMLKVDADARSTPAERTKTVEEVAIKEKEKLEEMENLRIARMDIQRNKRVHISADADFNRSFNDSEKKRIKQADNFMVRFDSQGKLIDGEKVGIKILKYQLVVCYLCSIKFKFSKLIDLLGLYPTCKMGTIIERIVKCNHPSLQKGNKQKLMKLFLLLLRLFDDTAQETPTENSILIIEILTKSLFDIMKFDIEYSVRCMRAFIRQNWKLRSGKVRRSEPSFTIIALLRYDFILIYNIMLNINLLLMWILLYESFFRLVASLYPVSDVWHPVCTPAMALAAVTLANCYVTSLSVLARQVLVVTVIGDFVENSKRYIPEAISFLRGALLLAVENSDNERAPSVAFPLSLPHRRMLYIDDAIDREVVVEPLVLGQVFDAKNSDSLDDTPLNKCRVLRALVAIIQKFRLIYAAHEHTFTALFTPFLKLLKRIPINRLPSVLSEEIDALIQSVEAECMRKMRLTQLSQVKTEKRFSFSYMIKMLEPRFEENFDPERPRVSRDSNRKGASAEKKKLQHLYKKEMRGAIKELRKDNSFLNRKQRKDVQAKDRDRRMKMKKLMQADYFLPGGIGMIHNIILARRSYAVISYDYCIVCQAKHFKMSVAEAKDWKSSLTLPAKDRRFKTAVRI